MNKVLVISPHPDDETLGCAGTLLSHKNDGCDIHWVIMTSMPSEENPSRLNERKKEIEEVKNTFGFKSVQELNLETSKLDSMPLSKIIDKLSKIMSECSPDIIYIPYRFCLILGLIH